MLFKKKQTKQPSSVVNTEYKRSNVQILHRNQLLEPRHKILLVLEYFLLIALILKC